MNRWYRINVSCLDVADGERLLARSAAKGVAVEPWESGVGASRPESIRRQFCDRAHPTTTTRSVCEPHKQATHLGIVEELLLGWGN